MTLMTPLLWEIMIVMLIGAIYFIFHLEDLEEKITSLRFLKVTTSFLIVIIAYLAFSIVGGITGAQINQNQATQTQANQFELEIRYNQEVATATEWKNTQRLKGGNAWWFNMTPAELEAECNAIAGKMNMHHQALIVLLSKQNCILTWAPAGLEIPKTNPQ